MKHVVNFSGGTASWATAKRVVELYGPDDVILLFADVKGKSTHQYAGEHPDLYRFLNDASANLGIPVTRTSEGRDIWQVFKDERFIGNHLVDPCSKILKRKLLDRWMTEHFDPADVTRHVGYTFEEVGRLEGMVKRSKWTVRAPLCEPPEMFKQDVYAWCDREGLVIPYLNRKGFNHNNCGGFCIKAGQAHFALLWRVDPDRYLYHEAKEQELREYLGKDVSVLREQRYGRERTLTLRTLRERLQAQIPLMDPDDWGGCGCMDDRESELTAPFEG